MSPHTRELLLAVREELARPLAVGVLGGLVDLQVREQREHVRVLVLVRPEERPAPIGRARVRHVAAALSEHLDQPVQVAAARRLPHLCEGRRVRPVLARREPDEEREEKAHFRESSGEGAAKERREGTTLMTCAKKKTKTPYHLVEGNFP